MGKKSSNYEDDDSIIIEDDEENLNEDSDEDYDLDAVEEEVSNKRRLIEEKLEEYKLKRQLEDDFDF